MDKRRLTLIVAAAAAVVLMAALLLVWSPWSGDAEPAGTADSRTSASETDTSTSTTPSDDSSTTTGGSGSPRPSDDPTAGPTTDDGAGPARVPTVVGMPLAQAVAEVKADFEDVRTVAQPNGAGEACTVIAQDPASGAHPANTRVTLTYAGTETECSP